MTEGGVVGGESEFSEALEDTRFLLQLLEMPERSKVKRSALAFTLSNFYRESLEVEDMWS